MQYLLLPRKRTGGASPVTRYSCVDGECVEDPDGDYETLEACQAACWTPGANSCNSCDPALPDVIYWNGSGFSGDWTPLNAKIGMEWISGCDWQSSSEGPGGSVPPWGTATWLIQLYGCGPLGDNGWQVTAYLPDGYSYLTYGDDCPACDVRQTWSSVAPYPYTSDPQPTGTSGSSVTLTYS